MAKKRQVQYPEFNNKLYVYILRKCWALMKKEYGNDNGRRAIIKAKYDLSKCNKMFTMMRSYCASNSNERWQPTKRDLIRPAFFAYDYDFTDSETGNSFNVMVSRASYGEDESRYNNPQRIRIQVNGYYFEHTDTEKILFLKILDEMKAGRENIINLERTQRLHEEQQLLWDSYGRE